MIWKYCRSDLSANLSLNYLQTSYFESGNILPDYFCPFPFCLTSPPSFIRISLGVCGRMKGMWSLSVSHYPIMIVRGMGLCPMMKTCRTRMRERYPIDRVVKSASFARVAGYQLVREHMLAPAESAPDRQNSGACQPRTWRWRSLCRGVNARTVSARRTRFLPALPHSYVPVKGVWGLCPHV